jgi:MFS family permease
MVKDFNIGDINDAALYCGILIAAFALSESLSGMLWGSYSDKVGRKPVLLVGCVGTIVSLLLVGFSTSYWMALTGRIIGGLLNGNVGVIQTMVGELVKKPEHERESPEPNMKTSSLTLAARAFAVMPFVWSIGTILGPVRIIE